jgi:hypothetical protein
MSLEDLLAAQVKATETTNSLLRELVAAQCGDLVKIGEAEKRMSISRATIMRRISEGLYTPHRDGRTTRVSLSQMRQVMQDEAR